nr:hypothetical protein [Candidatus Sigynarchaeota archaeon]
MQIIQNDRVHCGLSPTSGDAELLLLTAADYTNYINMQDYDYVNYVSYSGFVYSSRLDAGAYYILVYNIGTETAVGSITYWIDHEVDPAMVFFGISMACVFISLFAAVIVAARRGKKIKVWDARQGRNV